MALLFVDSFDHYSTVLDKWTAQLNNGGSINSSGGRNGTGSMRFSNYQNGYSKSLPGNYGTLVLGVAFRTSALGNLNLQPLISFLDNGTMQTEVRLESTGRLRVSRNGTQLGSTGTTVLSPNVFYFLELKVLFDPSVGTVQLKINGTTEINLTGQNTRASANSYANQVALGQVTGAGNEAATIDYDDLYVCDTSGGSPTNDFLGDVRVEARFPNGNGATSNLVGSDSNSTDNYLLVDESTPNSDTDYVESSTVGDKDTYTFQDLTSASGTVFGVQINPYARKTDAGTRSIKSVARLSATEVDSADKTLSTSYGYLPDIRETKPGGGAWSISDVNSAEFGVKVSA